MSSESWAKLLLMIALWAYVGITAYSLWGWKIASLIVLAFIFVGK